MPKRLSMIKVKSASPTIELLPSALKNKFASSPFLVTPIFFGFPLYCGVLWLLALDPVARAAGAVGRAKPLRHNALEAELTSMAKHNVARFCDVIVDLQPYAGLGEQSD